MPFSQRNTYFPGKSYSRGYFSQRSPYFLGKGDLLFPGESFTQEICTGEYLFPRNNYWGVNFSCDTGQLLFIVWWSLHNIFDTFSKEIIASSDDEGEDNEEEDTEDGTLEKHLNINDDEKDEQSHEDETNENADNEWSDIKDDMMKPDRLLEAKSKESHIVHCPYFPQVCMYIICLILHWYTCVCFCKTHFCSIWNGF